VSLAARSRFATARSALTSWATTAIATPSRPSRPGTALDTLVRLELRMNHVDPEDSADRLGRSTAVSGEHADANAERVGRAQQNAPSGMAAM
jgi:hypothetical protein